MALSIVEERGTAIKGWQQASRINLCQAVLTTHHLDSVLMVSGMAELRLEGLYFLLEVNTGWSEESSLCVNNAASLEIL